MNTTIMLKFSDKSIRMEKHYPLQPVEEDDDY